MEDTPFKLARSRIPSLRARFILHPEGLSLGGVSAFACQGASSGATKMEQAVTKDTGSARSIAIPLALAQFICSYAASNMNVAVTDIARDLGTTVIGVQ